MRILYLSLSYVPSRRASSVQVTKMCAALARRGHEVVLVAKRGNEPAGDDHAFYKVEHSFTIDKISRPTRRGGGVVYAAGMAVRIARHRKWADLVYCRDPLGVWLAAEARLPVVFEAHGVPSSRWIKAMLARSLARPNALGLVAISDALRTDLVAAGLQHPKMLVAHDAADPPSTQVQPRTIATPASATPVIGYVGNLYAGRGIETLVALARVVDARFRVVGGTESDLAKWRATNLPPNLELLGFRPQSELPALYRTFDVVVMPHAMTGVVGATGASDISRWTSPMKMFEYMASGVPIVASRLPVLCEVLRHDDNALLVDSSDVGAWKIAVEQLLSDEALRLRLASRAQADVVRHYTWDARAASIMRGLGLESVVR